METTQASGQMLLFVWAGKLFGEWCGMTTGQTWQPQYLLMDGSLNKDVCFHLPLFAKKKTSNCFWKVTKSRLIDRTACASSYTVFILQFVLRAGLWKWAEMGFDCLCFQKWCNGSPHIRRSLPLFPCVLYRDVLQCIWALIGRLLDCSFTRGWWNHLSRLLELSGGNDCQPCGKYWDMYSVFMYKNCGVAILPGL